MNKQKPKYGPVSNVAFMLRLAWAEHKSVIFLMIAIAALGVSLNLLQLYALPVILSLIGGGDAAALMRAILLFAAGIAVVSSLTEYAEINKLFGRMFVRRRLVNNITNKLETTSFPHMEDSEYLKMSDRAFHPLQSNNEAAEAIWNTVGNILKNTAGFAVYAAILLSLDPVISGVTALTAAAGYFISLKTSSWRYRHREQEAEITHRMRYISRKAKDVSLAKDVRVFGMGGWLRSLSERYNGNYRAFVQRGERVGFAGDAVNVLLEVLRGAVAYWYLIGSVLSGAVTVPQFLLYFTAVSGFTAWVSDLLSEFGVLYRQSLELSTYREFMDIKEPFNLDTGEHISKTDGEKYEICLRGVYYKYPGAEDYTLKNINLTVEAGSSLAVVGMNGAGKTTLIKLMCGLYDPTKGSVLLNGRDIREYNRRDYYTLFSAVFQKFSVIAATVAENVACAERTIDEGRVQSSLERAGILDKINSLPNGIDTNLCKNVFDDACELSGGETQRLMLARALYKAAPIIVLDEPTAALDPIAESDIYSRYSELTRGCTSVYISHRLASTRFCDRVILIESGGIAEDGTHRSLMAAGGRYAQLFELQSRYYSEGENNEQ